MTSYVVLPFILLIMFIVKAEAGVEQLYQHVGTKRFLTGIGHAFSNFRDTSLALGPVGRATLIVVWPEGIGYNDQKLIFTHGPFEFTEDWERPFVFDIGGGCHVNNTVKYHEINGGPNQRWIFNADGSITSACDPDWRLTVGNDGWIHVAHVNHIPKEDLAFRSVSYSEFDRVYGGR